ncbi:hypothetical protein DFH06DRAFT_1156487 [Mycena polygramma]|nr:hypothetical protein DFH06DRAFT_1156487 [Mycena polygramma]
MTTHYGSLANAWIDLIFSVAPFQDRFVEPDLQDSIRHLLETAARMKHPSSTAAPQDLVPSPPAPPTDPVHLAPFLATVIEPSQRMRPSSSSLASALTPTAASHTAVNSPVPVTDHALSTPVQETQPPLPPPTNAAPAVEPVPLTSSAKPKRKKKKKEDLSKLIQADVQHYYQKKGNMQKPTVDAQTGIGGVAPIASTSRVTLEDIPVRDGGSRADSPAAPASEIHSNLIASLSNQPAGMEMTDSPTQALSSASTGDALPATGSEALSPALNKEVIRVLHTLTGSASTAEVADSRVDEAMPAVSPDVKLGSQPTPELETAADIEGVVDMEVDTPPPQPGPADATVTDAGLAPGKTAHTPAVLQAIIKNMVNNVNKLIASDTVPPRPTSLEELPAPSVTDETEPDGGEFSTINLPVSEDFHMEDFTPSTKTGIEAATVITSQRGLASGTIKINLTITEDQLISIAKWNDRSKHSDDLKQSLCISLLCFAMDDVKTQLESSKSNDLCTLLPELECSWPSDGGLSMNALWNGQRMRFPMSPPFALPPNGLVDVNLFLVLGKNTFRITQTRDMSKYWLLLCAHRPTPYQLNAVARRRHKETKWNGWLGNISQPLQLPFRMPIEA